MKDFWKGLWESLGEESMERVRFLALLLITFIFGIAVSRGYQCPRPPKLDQETATKIRILIPALNELVKENQ